MNGSDGTADHFLKELSYQELEFLKHDWPTWAHDHQLPPAGLWRVWMLLGGRGAGKTRAGAEWVRAMAMGHGWATRRPAGRIALVGETISDAREVMVEGVSGILSVHPRAERPEWQPSRRRLEWPNGAVAQTFSSEDPEALRGPQFDIAWCDELAKWRHGQATFDMLQFSLRLGDNPRQLVTTTPRPVPLVKSLMADGDTALSRAPTRANGANLAPGFLTALKRTYEGTRLGRQELDGELVEDRPGALWSRDMLERARVSEAPELKRIVVAVDPPASSGKRSDACGMIVAGLAEDGRAYVIADRSLKRARPADWGRAAISAWRMFEADCLIAEVNQGGEMVSAIIAGIDAGVPVKTVHATRGKWLRAEPVALLYEQGKVAHVGAFPDLEDEMADFAPDGLSSGHSPDRLDALVHALSELMLNAPAAPRIRRM
ncbi:DNA-packaging protein [Hongsoonwoonella zoysiae]|uniref:DNA-packaging protein n=1 Tax=Hongsoonwoonella zoysiae TaxID=2821844 RepID=UPI001FEBE33A|nr:terminase family protein [Hongsoonwoonella zoysiae]